MNTLFSSGGISLRAHYTSTIFEHITCHSPPHNAVQLCRYGGHALFTTIVEYILDDYVGTEVCCHHYFARSLKTDGEGFYMITMFNLFKGVFTIALLVPHEYKGSVTLTQIHAYLQIFAKLAQCKTHNMLNFDMRINFHFCCDWSISGSKYQTRQPRKASLVDSKLQFHYLISQRKIPHQCSLHYS